MSYNFSLPEVSRPRGPLPGTTSHAPDCAKAALGKLAVFCALLVLSVAAPLPAGAQFSGPAPGGSTQLNQPVSLTTDPQVLGALPPDFRLASGDMISIRVYGVDQFNISVRLSVDGSVQLPLIGMLQLQGLTIPEAENRIARKLIDDGMVLEPQVTVQVTEAPNRVATVTGEVRTPSVVSVLGQRRLIDILSAAGGLNPTASHVITIHRQGITAPITVDLGTDPAHSQQADIPVFPGDTIVVSRTGVVYLLGAFKVQGAFPLNPNTPLTLMEAVSLGGGSSYDGKLSDARIVRTVGTQRKEIPIDVTKIENGTAPDPLLQADDIIFLPNSILKAAIRNGGIGTLLGVFGILLFLIPHP